MTRKDMVDRAIDDYDSVLRLDPTLVGYPQCPRRAMAQERRPAQGACGFWRRDQAEPGSSVGARQLQVAGAGSWSGSARLMAVAGKPSFNCGTARRAVEKAICANPELADLDREINAVNTKVVRQRPATARVPAAPCSASRTNSSPAATPPSAGRTTICARPCRSGWTICWRSSGIRRKPASFDLEMVARRVTIARKMRSN